ncbi:hypothetical protein UlMin_031938 [Ulmus minor]
MASLSPIFLFLAISLWILLISPAQSLTCTSQKFKKNNLYTNCSDLSVLTSYLHWTYNASNSSLSIAFNAPPAKSDGWVAWAINPTGTGMAGAQALVAVRDSNGSISVTTYNINNYTSLFPAKLSFDVWDTSAEYSNGTITIFAAVKVPEKMESLNYIWQVGPGVNKTTGFLDKHEFAKNNLAAKDSLQLTTVAVAPATDSTGNSTDTHKNGAVSRFEIRNYLVLYVVSLLVIIVGFQI